MSAGHSLPFADDRILLNLAAYWSAKRGADPLPARNAIDPLDMPRRLLPYLALVERTGNGAEIRFRLVGTELVQRFGRDATGKTSSELFQAADYRLYVESIYAAVFTKAQPLFVESLRGWPDEGHGRVSRLLLPIAARSGESQAGFVLSAISWAPTDGTGYQQQPVQRLIAVEALEKGVLQATLRGLLDPP